MLRKFVSSRVLPAVLLFALPALAEEPVILSAGQTLYVPVYSNVFTGDRPHSFSLAALLSIRNVDLHDSIEVTSIDYYDNDGKLLRQHLDEPMLLAPLASNHVYVKQSDESGGFGANFIVRWSAERKINAPIVESVMIGTKSGQGVSFQSPARVIAERGG